ncbi:hypothetical protein HOP50_20g86040 [Chloropicon primus]|uniref:Uncharacterized protein n=1 Tax=Chloropicon primus TaxID=1764295 RepID=A0A5B8MZP4_9CHLO|nr:hypothetical protein A3770_20p85710 [Chloropicon primus]UPR05254.1 hypothetical protein HOP50_20g86040 [Chloropicon primus]|eukprot:QDZ26053.1 hypothetical protein A3770_20p85710 [Chloropicon primus]
MRMRVVIPLLAVLGLVVGLAPASARSHRARSARFKQPSNLFQLRMNTNPTLVSPNVFAASGSDAAGRSATVREITPWAVNTKSESVGSSGSTGTALGGSGGENGYMGGRFHSGASSGAKEYVTSYTDTTSRALPAWVWTG